MARFGAPIIRQSGAVAGLSTSQENINQGNIDVPVQVTANRLGQSPQIQQQQLALEAARRGFTSTPEYQQISSTVNEAQATINTLEAEKQAVQQRKAEIDSMQVNPNSIGTIEALRQEKNVLNRKEQAINTSLQVARESAGNLQKFKPEVAKAIVKGDTATASQLVSSAREGALPLEEYRNYISQVESAAESQQLGEARVYQRAQALQKVRAELGPETFQQLQETGTLSVEQAQQLSPTSLKVIGIKKSDLDTVEAPRLKPDVFGRDMSSPNQSFVDVQSLQSTDSNKGFFGKTFDKVKGDVAFRFSEADKDLTSSLNYLKDKAAEGKSNRELLPYVTASIGTLGISFAKGVIVNTPRAGYTLLTTPLSESLKGAASAGKSGFVSVASFNLKTPIQQQQIVSDLLADPSTVSKLGTFGGELLASEIAFAGVAKVPSTTKSIYVRSTSEFVPPQQVFNKGVLQGTQKFPYTESVDDTLRQFLKTKTEQGYISGTHSTDIDFKATEIGGGRKGDIGLEDAGLYITPRGQGSPYFLGLSQQTKQYQFTFNPLKIFSQPSPTVVNIQFKEIATLPKDVLAIPGFDAVNKFIQSRAGESKAFVTKRSTIGLGEIQPQYFASSKSFKSPFEGGQTVTRDGKIMKVSDVEVGDVLIEKGTSELEAVIPKGAIISKAAQGNMLQRFRGYSQYTLVDGRTVPLKEYKIIEDNLIKSNAGMTNDYTKLLQDIEQNYFSSSRTRTVYDTPYSKLPAVSVKTNGSQSTLIPVQRYSLSGDADNISYKVASKSSDIVTNADISSQDYYVPEIIPTPEYNFGGSYTPVVARYDFQMGQSYATPSFMPITNTATRVKRFDNSFMERPKKKTRARAFSVLIKRRGQFRPVATNLPFSRALLAGETEALRSLGRTFKLVETGTTSLSDISYRPSQAFRQYKIRQGRPLPLNNTFIQRRGIDTGMEKAALAEARRQAKILNSI